MGYKSYNVDCLGGKFWWSKLIGFVDIEGLW